MSKELIWVTSVEKAYDSLNWRADSVEWDDLLQVSDGYVVHARGFTLDDDVWLDQYNVHRSHKAFYNSYIRQEYGFDEYDHWYEYDHGFEHTPLYWSISGGPKILLQYPPMFDMDAEAWYRFYQTFDEMGTPDDVNVGALNFVRGQSHAESLVNKREREHITFTFGELRNRVETLLRKQNE